MPETLSQVPEHVILPMLKSRIPVDRQLPLTI